MQDKKLNLKREFAVKKPNTPQEAAEFMANYNATMMDGLLNGIALLSDIAESLRMITIDISDLVEYKKITSVKQGLLTEDEIEAQENDDQDDPDYEP